MIRLMPTPANKPPGSGQSHSDRLVLLIHSPELLYPLTGIHLGGEDVALTVDGDVVQRSEHAHLPSGATEAAERFFRRVVDQTHLAVHAIDHIDELLLLVGREYEIVDRAGATRCLLIDMLGDEAAVLAENLQAIVDAVADMDETILVDANAMHRIAELLRWRAGRIVGRRLLIAWLVAIGAPVALVGASLGVKHHHAAVRVAVGGEHFLRHDVDGNVCRRAKPLRRIAVVSLPLFPDLQDKLAIHRELEQLPV